MIQRTKLETILDSYYKTHHFDKEIMERIKSIMLSKHNVMEGASNGILLSMDSLSKLTDEELLWYAQATLVVDDSLFTLADYFSELEINNWSGTKRSKSKKIYPLVFEPALQIAPDQFVTTITNKQLYDLYQKQQVVYNIFTQRAPRTSIRRGQEYTKIYMNRRSVSEIRDLLERELFIPNTLTFNVREENFGKVEYDAENQKLYISSTVDILDGAHRASGIIQATQENPNFEITFVLNIMTFTETKAKRFIAQEDKRNKITPSYTKSLDNTKYENLVITRLNEDSQFYLYNKIKAYGSDRLDAGTLIQCVGDVFAPQDNMSAVKIEQYIRDTVNSLIDTYPDLANKFETSDFRIVIICSKLFEDKEDKLERINHYIQYSRENKLGSGTKTIMNHIIKLEAEK